MKHVPEPEFVAFIVIDWADAKHDVCLQPANTSKREFSVIVHRPEAIEAWAQELKRRFPGGSISVCLELTKGPLVSALAKYDFLALFPVNPSTLARYRQAFTPSHAKDDPTDAELQLELLLHHPDKLKRLDPPSRAMRTLQHLVEQRRRLVDDRRRITNQITCALKQYFPQALDERRDRFPDAAALQKYSGIAPVTERSGKKHWVHWRAQCPKFLRQTFVEWAAETIPRSFWAGAYYQQQRAKGCSHQVALRALAFKWVRILYRCWQTRTPYDESTYLNALKRRGSPLLNSIALESQNA